MLTTGLRRSLRRVSGLAVGTAVSGVLAYVFFALVTRALGAERAAPVSVLWAWWSFTGAGLTFPLQHWIARTVAATGTEGGVRRALGPLTTLLGLIALAAGGLAGLLRHLLFHDQGLAFPALSALVVLGSGLMGLVRGVLTARRRFHAIGAGLVAENAVRCVAALVLILADVHEPVAYGACLVIGYVAAFAFPGAFRPSHDGGPAATTTLFAFPGAFRPSHDGGPAATPFAFLGGAGAGQLIAQAVLTGGPVLLAIAGGAPANVTALFAGLALFRAPYTLAVGVLAPATERVTRLVVHGHHQALHRLRIGIASTVVAGVVLGALFGPWAGPPLVRLVFGEDIRLPGTVSLLIAAGTIVAMGNLVLTVLLMARDRTSALTRAWVVSLVPGALWFAFSGAGLLTRATVTFVLVETAALLWLAGEELLADRVDSTSP